MGSKSLNSYFDKENLQTRVSWLREYGHESNVWGEKSRAEVEWVLEIVDPYYVSKPCWKEICGAADRADNSILDLNRRTNQILPKYISFSFLILKLQRQWL